MAMTLRLTDDETQALRAQAEAEHRSMQEVARAAAALFLWINGHDLDAPEDGAFDLVIAVADGSLADVEKIAECLAGWSQPR